MNIYLITVGTLGFIGFIKIRRNAIKQIEKEKEQWQPENRRNNKSFIDCWQEVHRSTTECIFANVVYNLLYVYSLCQIKCNQIARYFHQHHKKIENKSVLYLDSNGKIDVAKNNDNNNALYSDGPNRVFCQFIHDSDNFPNYDVSKIHFINVELEYGGKIYPMPLKTDSVNYYIVNNCLNSFFVKYYIQNVLKMPINENEYTIHIIDHNVNCITLNQVQKLTFTEDGYEIE